MTTSRIPRAVAAAATAVALAAGAALAIPAAATAAGAAPAPRDIAAGDCPAQMPPLSSDNPLYVDNSVAVYAGGRYLATGAAAESEGLMVVRGDAIFDKEWGGVYNVGSVGVGSQITPEGGSTMLAVGGDLRVGEDTRLEVGARLPGGGGVLVGGTLEGTVQTFGGPRETGIGSYAALAQWGDFYGTVQQTSAGLAALSATGTTSRGPGVIFTGNGADELQVFTVDASTLEGAAEFRFANVTDTMPIVVNVVGGPIVDLQSNFVAVNGVRVDTTTSPDLGTASSRILWNFVDTPLVNFNGSGQWIGSVLVPQGDANLDVSTNGRLYVGGDLYTHGGGNEHHNYPWIGLQCSPVELTPAEGGFAVKKTVTGDAADLVPSDTAFTVEYAYSVDGTPTTGMLTVSPDGMLYAGPQNLPAGTVVTFTEVDLPSIDGVVWGAPSFSPASLTVGEGEIAEILLTNTADAAPTPVGGFSVAKALDGAAASLVPAGTEFTVEYAYELEGVPTSGTLSVLADGTVVDGPQNLAAGTVVTFTEANLPPVDGVVWGAPSFSPSSVTVGDGSNTLVTLTNTAEEVVVPVGGFSLAKAVTGAAAASVPADTAFTVEYAYDLDGVPTTGTLTVLADGTVVDGPQNLPAGTVVTFTEIDLPSVPGVVWDAPAFSADTITIGDGENTLVTLTNTAQEVVVPVGGFSLAKALTGPAVGLVPAGTAFTVDYAYELEGAAITGTLSLLADGTVVDGPQNLPAGTVVTFTEVQLPDIAGVVWGAPALSADTVTIGDGSNTLVTLTNTADAAPAPVGGFSVAKALEGAAASLVPADTVFTVEYAYDLEGVPTTGTLSVRPDGTVVDGPQNLAVGTVVTFTEVDLPSIDGVVWGAPSFSAASVTIGDGENALVTLTNTAQEVVIPVGGFSLAKAVTGAAASLVPADTEFTVQYAYDLDGVATTGTLTLLADGTVVDGPQTLPVGTVVTFTEVDLPSIDGVVWGAPSFSAASVTIGDGENALVTLTNTAQEVVVPVGGFSLAKALTGAATELIPADTAFTVEYRYQHGDLSLVGQATLLADGTVVDGPQTLPVGTVVTFTEVDLPSIDGVVWGAPSFSAESVTIGDGDDTLVTVTNTAEPAETPEEPENPMEPEEPGNPEEPVTPTGPEGLLAYTGAASVAGIVLAALSLLAAGFTTLALRRRRTGRQG